MVGVSWKICVIVSFEAFLATQRDGENREDRSFPGLYSPTVHVCLSKVSVYSSTGRKNGPSGVHVWVFVASDPRTI